jgi:hypothetical protein
MVINILGVAGKKGKLNIFEINPLKTRGNYMNHLLYQSLTLHFVFMGFV